MRCHDEVLVEIYHKGQDKIWDGRKVLSDLMEKYDVPVELDPKIRNSINRIFTMILRGEEAAWKISLQLGSMIDSFPARMAVTSQAHDEARHFYVMNDYLELCGSDSSPLPASINKALDTAGFQPSASDTS